ncbi:hypothetical protein ACOME3_010252 [Neoechinorhynchus agilis]
MKFMKDSSLRPDAAAEQDASILDLVKKRIVSLARSQLMLDSPNAAVPLNRPVDEQRSRSVFGKDFNNRIVNRVPKLTLNDSVPRSIRELREMKKKRKLEVECSTVRESCGLYEIKVKTTCFTSPSCELNLSSASRYHFITKVLMESSSDQRSKDLAFRYLLQDQNMSEMEYELSMWFCVQIRVQWAKGMFKNLMVLLRALTHFCYNEHCDFTSACVPLIKELANITVGESSYIRLRGLNSASQRLDLSIREYAVKIIERIRCAHYASAPIEIHTNLAIVYTTVLQRPIMFLGQIFGAAVGLISIDRNIVKKCVLRPKFIQRLLIALHNQTSNVIDPMILKSVIVKVDQLNEYLMDRNVET